MTFRNKIRQTIFNQFIVAAGSGASSETITSLGNAADDIADAVGNTVHDDLIIKIEAVNSAIADFVAAYLGATPVPGDGGLMVKTTVSPALSALATASASLTVVTENYK